MAQMCTVDEMHNFTQYEIHQMRNQSEPDMAYSLRKLLRRFKSALAVFAFIYPQSAVSEVLGPWCDKVLPYVPETWGVVSLDVANKTLSIMFNDGSDALIPLTRLNDTTWRLESESSRRNDENIMILRDGSLSWRSGEREFSKSQKIKDKKDCKD